MGKERVFPFSPTHGCTLRFHLKHLFVAVAVGAVLSFLAARGWRGDPLGRAVLVALGAALLQFPLFAAFALVAWFGGGATGHVRRRVHRPHRTADPTTREPQ